MTEFIYVSGGGKSHDMLMVLHNSIVIPVNTLGIMGAGLAKQYKDQFPDSAQKYIDLCKSRKDSPMNPGALFHHKDPDHHALFFFTKDHYKDPSQIEYITRGLKSLRVYLMRAQYIKDVGMPKIGCGLGGLDWKEVHHEIITILDGVSQMIHIYGENPERTK